MLTPKQNFLETLKKDGKPDRLVKQYENLFFFPGDPVAGFVRGKRYQGMPPLKDKWGTTILWPEDQFAAMPSVADEHKVVRDVTRWRDYTSAPDIVGNCSDPALWEPALEAISKIDRDEYLLMTFMPTGVFEQLHFLMGFEDTLTNFLLEPEAMKDLSDAIGEYRFNFAKLLVDNLKPDIMLSHDDWGSKNNLFMSPEVWREFIKPQYVKTYKYCKDNGVIVMHHADSFLEPIVEDMVELNIDIWQGVLPQNDIPAIQKKLDGRMTLMGGIDAAIVDRKDATEEEIRAEVRRVCEEYAPGGHFIPCITYGAMGTIYPHVDPIINDEIDRYNREVYGI
ncbi:MAG TPA: uroporphyrinogen decarboxylase (URO-D) [Clostridiales bacterium]|nr:uroporphyrinogen decarboxylase (URO-D) [Clostridiales bacterium]